MSPTLAQTDPEFVKRTFASIASRYDFANHLLSAGLDYFWRRRVAQRVAKVKPASILDLATGSGDLALALQKACPAATVTGADFCLPMLELARRKGLKRLVQADGLALPFASESFNVVTVAFGLRNMADWNAAIQEMQRVLKPDGELFILDFSLPEWEPALPVYRFYLHRVLPKLAEWATQRREAYKYLGGSIELFPSGLAMNAMLQACGLVCESPQTLTFGIVRIYNGKKRPVKEPTD